MPFVIHFASLCFRLFNSAVFDFENILIALVIDSSIIIFWRLSAVICFFYIIYT